MGFLQRYYVKVSVDYSDPRPMHPVALAREWEVSAPDTRRAIEVPGVNHYTIALGAHGARAVADAIADATAT